MTEPLDSAKARVVIVEDHPMFRERLALLINREDDMMVCGEADNARDGLLLIQQTKPQIAIVDISLRGSGGLDLIKDMRAQEINVPVPPGSVIHVLSGGGGGWGDPKRRDPAARAYDAAEGLTK